MKDKEDRSEEQRGVEEGREVGQGRGNQVNEREMEGGGGGSWEEYLSCSIYIRA